MLDTTTKRRIDTARDILVGKVPDPKSQVEQITIALIYKFMDDMDLEAEELGGIRSFFTGDYEKYSWHMLFDPTLSGFEVLALYSEALLKLSLNPALPQLLRDIFKNAYLPYRDPETLKSFIKIINDFRYDHSEQLGDAFEYLLSVLGSQGDAGQFRTPRHIIDFMVELIDPQKQDRILDPACGTAGFLISSYKHIWKNNSSNYNPVKDKPAFEIPDAPIELLGALNGKGYNGDKLTPDERARLTDNICGFDISPDMVRLSLVNLYLHGFTEPHIYEYDTLTSEERWNEYYDVIMANPPFMSPKGGIRPHKRFSVESNRSEVLFVDYIAEHLTPTGRAAIIVPEGIIFQSGSAYKKLRKMLVDENYLVGVISLPAGVFNPYSGVKTSILWIDKTLARKTNKILFIKISNDGFDLGAQRRPIKLNDLPTIHPAILQYKQSLEKGVEFQFTDESKLLLVDRESLAKNGEYNFSGDRYKLLTEKLSNAEMITLEEVCEIISDGTHQTPKYENEGVIFLSSKNVTSGKIDWDNIKYISEELHQELSKHIQPQINDILLAKNGTTGVAAIVDKDIVFNIYVSLAILRTKPPILPRFLLAIINSPLVKEQFNSRLQGIGVPNLHLKEIKGVKIPLPSLSIQQEIVSEIESYQKIIDGARQVVENYKPRIDIDPAWEMVELGKVCELNPKKSEIANRIEDMEVSFVPMAIINENQMEFYPIEKKRISEVYTGYTYFKDGDVVVAKVTPCFENGKAGIAQGLTNTIGFGSSELYVLRCSVKVDPVWIYVWVTSDKFRAEGKTKMTGTGGLQRVPKDFVSTFLIPVPDIATQRSIVAQIKEEQQIVQSNKRLIELYEQKIKDRIKRVWGE